MQKYRIELKWAIIFMIVSLVWMFMEKLLGWHDEHIDKHAVYTNFFAIPSILMFLFALHDKKKNFFEGSMSWRQGVVTGIVISAIIAILSPLAQYITNTIITPDYFQNAINHAVSSGNASQEQAEAFFNMKSFMMSGFVGAFGMGVFTSLILSLATMNNPKTLAQAIGISK